LLNASVDVQRVMGRLLRTSARSSTPEPARTSKTLDRALRGIRSLVVAAHLAPTRDRGEFAVPISQAAGHGLVARVGPDRVVAAAALAIVVAASALSVVPGSGPSGPVGGPTGDGPGPRIAVAGSFFDVDPEIVYGSPSRPVPVDDLTRLPLDEIGDLADPAVVEGPFLEDGTLLKPIAVDTTVADASELIRTYKVRSGDTLTGIANRFGVSMMTVWWANKLKTKDLKVGQELVIPPVNGLVVTVDVGDTLESLAKKHKVKEGRILAANELTDPNLVVGQVLLMPGAKGAPIPTPKPTPKPTPRPRATTVRAPAQYSGGRFAWPVAGGYISQYYRYGHYAIDIAADYGTRVRAAAGGKVIFAGWKSNGGGYQVWIAHGSNLYTTYNHMSAITVGNGQSVSRGQQVGRIGTSGYATGPHLHFEVWRGQVWNGGSRVNPLNYL
jgi:murein DD-endopeptidase MepM/ murein hydrolase activator NlpD